ncbi:MAG: FAD-dependent monooxygenase [Acidisphaera sp.]|nr:FAD-dependent monooxygenase [Acidisphaera sp.]
MSGDPDVIVAGGGVAGCAAASCLATLGWSVLLVEPGQHEERRLSGEFIHPACVADLAELGLLAPADIARAAPLRGFAVFAEPSPTPPMHLLYRSGDAGRSTALALDHGTLRRTLLDAAGRIERVSVARGCRVVGLDDGAPGRSAVHLARGGQRETVPCRLLVAADGASSRVRDMAGIAHRRHGGARFSGYRIGSEALPAPGLGHVFLGAKHPVLAYAIGDGAARVLFEQPVGPDRRARPDECTAMLPAPLREALGAAVSAGGGLGFAARHVAVSAVVRGGVALVGDAAGSCHPLTASGMSMAVADAFRLRDALCRASGDVALALRLYARERRAQQRARMLLAALLHDTLGGTAPAMEFLRDGLLRYWMRSAGGRAASLQLIASTETRVHAVLHELAWVALHGLCRPPGGLSGLARQVGAMAKLALPIMRLTTDTIRIQ